MKSAKIKPLENFALYGITKTLVVTIGLAQLCWHNFETICQPNRQKILAYRQFYQILVEALSMSNVTFTLLSTWSTWWLVSGY